MNSDYGRAVRPVPTIPSGPFALHSYFDGGNRASVVGF